MAKKLNTYSIYAVVKLDLAIAIQANDLDDALKRSKELEISDFCDIKGDHNDSELQLRGVFDDNINIYSK